MSCRDDIKFQFRNKFLYYFFVQVTTSPHYVVVCPGGKLSMNNVTRLNQNIRHCT